MRRRRAHRRPGPEVTGRLLVLVVLLTALVIAPAAATAAGPTSAPTSPPTGATTSAAGAVAVDVVSVGPPAVVPGSALAVRAVVRNTGEQALPALLVRLKLAPALLRSRAAVQDWAARTDDEFSGSRVTEIQVPAGLAPGTEVTVDLVIAADELPLPSAATGWGPRGVAVAVLDPDFAQLALARTHIVWFPGTSFSSPVRTSVVVPLSGAAPGVATGLVPDDEMEELTADGGRLQTVLAAASAPGVAWALDPALLASAQAGSGPAATGWLARLQAAAGDHEIVALPYADPDVSALAHAGQPQLHALAEEQGRDSIQTLLGEPARTDVAWPANGAVDAPTLDMLARDGRRAVLLSQGSLPLVTELDFTPTGRSNLTAGGRAVAGLLVDTPLSTTLAATGAGGVGGRVDDPVAVQRLLAETAAITMERPSVDRHVLVTAPRDWDPDAATGAAALAALTAVPWVRATPLDTLVGTAPPDVERAPLATRPDDRTGELREDTLRDVGAALASTRRMVPALTRPEDLLATAERSAVAAASVAWRDDTDAWREQVAELGAETTVLLNGVQVVPGSIINVLSARADLPLTVTNDLDQEVRVEVRLRPSTPRLVAEQDVPVTIAAGASERVAVPVRAVASGDTEVSVQVRTPAGEAIGEAMSFRVRVRADWENRGTLALAAVAALVMVVGLVRSIRRGRRTPREAAGAGAA